MAAKDILCPLLVQVGLTFALLSWMAYARVSALQRGDVKVRDIALSGDAWPERVRQISNSFQNQFELPVLFYLVVVLALVTKTADTALAGLAWGFVATRVVHALIHTTSNTVLHRFYAYLAGIILLVAMWGLFAVRLSAGAV